MITSILKAVGTALAHASIAALVAVGVVRLWPLPSQDIQLRQWATKMDSQVDANFKDVQSKITAIQATEGRQQQAIDSISLANYDRMRNDDSRQQLSLLSAQVRANSDRLDKHDALLDAHRVLIGVQRDRLDQMQPSTLSQIYWRY